MADDNDGRTVPNKEPAQPPPPPPIPPTNEAILPDAEQRPPDSRVQATVNLPSGTRTIEWLQLGASALLAVVGVVALCIYGGQLDVMKRQFVEMRRQPRLHKMPQLPPRTTLRVQSGPFRRPSNL